MRLWVLIIGLGCAGPAFAQEDPASEDPAVEEDPEAENPPRKRPEPPPVEMTPERKAKAEYWDERRKKEAKIWHAAVKEATDTWLAGAGLDAATTQNVRSEVAKVLETDNLIRTQLQAGEIRPKEGRERLKLNRGAAAETLVAMIGEKKVESLRAALMPAGGAF